MSGYPCPECSRNMPDPLEPCHCGYQPPAPVSGPPVDRELGKAAAEKAREALAEARKRSKEKQQ